MGVLAGNDRQQDHQLDQAARQLPGCKDDNSGVSGGAIGIGCWKSGCPGRGVGAAVGKSAPMSAQPVEALRYCLASAPHVPARVSKSGAASSVGKNRGNAWRVEGIAGVSGHALFRDDVGVYLVHEATYIDHAQIRSGLCNGFHLDRRF